MNEKDFEGMDRDAKDRLDELRTIREGESSKLSEMSEDEMVQHILKTLEENREKAEELGFKTDDSPVAGEIGEDEYADDDIVTLTTADGEEVDFVEIAGIAHKGNFYAILQPVELIDGMSDDEALVFWVTRNEKGEDKFEIVLDDDIINAVFAEYNRLLDATSGEEN